MPCVPPEAVPQSISISAYNSWWPALPVYARYILRLNELDEVQEAIEKRDYGEPCHDILRRFHERYPRVSDHAPGKWKPICDDQRGGVRRPAATGLCGPRLAGALVQVFACLSGMAGAERGRGLALCRSGKRVRLATGRRDTCAAVSTGWMSGNRRSGCSITRRKTIRSLRNKLREAGRGCATCMLRLGRHEAAE